MKKSNRDAEIKQLHNKLREIFKGNTPMILSEIKDKFESNQKYLANFCDGLKLVPEYFIQTKRLGYQNNPIIEYRINEAPLLYKYVKDAVEKSITLRARENRTKTEPTKQTPSIMKEKIIHQQTEGLTSLPNTLKLKIMKLIEDEGSWDDIYVSVFYK